MVETATRHTADERREAVLAAALTAFARGGLHATSTEDIAGAAGISQPYLFRLFGTKKALFIATVSRCMEDTLRTFREASEGLHGEEALRAMGDAYCAMVLTDRERLLCQMQAYAASDDADVRAAMRAGYRHLFEFVEARSGVPAEQVSSWFATGMLLNVAACLDLAGTAEPWARRLVTGVVGEDGAAEWFQAGGTA